MVRFRTLNTKWVRIVLCSIALHLAVVSILSAIRTQKPIELVYVPAVEITHQPAQKIAAVQPVKLKTTNSGARSSAEGLQRSQNSLRNLRESLYAVLNDNLKNRSRSLEMLLSLKFSTDGKLESSEVLRSSGLSEVDDEVTGILKSARLYSSPEFSNLRIQVPLRLR